METFEKAVTRAREGHGPLMIIGHQLRLCGHGEHDDASYISKKLMKQPFGGDCMAIALKHMIDSGIASKDQIEQWTDEALKKVKDATSAAQREPGPDPYQETWQALATTHLVEGNAET